MTIVIILMLFILAIVGFKGMDELEKFLQSGAGVGVIIILVGAIYFNFYQKKNKKK